MSDSKQKSSYAHGSDFERLRSYGHFYFPYTPSCETRFQNSWRLMAYSLHCKHYFCQLTRTQSSFLISTLGEQGEGGVGIRLATS